MTSHDVWGRVKGEVRSIWDSPDSLFSCSSVGGFSVSWGAPGVSSAGHSGTNRSGPVTSCSVHGGALMVTISAAA